MNDEGKSYLEVSHYPTGLKDRRWSQAELLTAARKAVCRNTGWPIGVVLTNPEMSPKPSKNGISATMPTNIGRFDFWSLDERGYFYLLRRFEEDSDDRMASGSSLYFDTRIWRIAEALLHCSNLYRALDIASETEVRIKVVHHGLKDRTLRASSWERAMTMLERSSRENDLEWSNTIPLGTIESNLETLVGEIAGQLFMLFDFWQPEVQVWKGVLKEFLSSRI